MSQNASGTVHVIIPTRNRFELTQRAARSIQAQTHQGWRLTVVDDASDDGSGAALRREFLADERIAVDSLTSQRGAPLARQHVLDGSEAEFIAILDSDDVWAPPKLEKQLARAGGFDAVLCGHEWRTAGTGLVLSSSVPLVAPDGSADPLVSANMSAPLLRRSTLVDAGGFAKNGVGYPTCDGIDLFVRLSARARFAVVPEILVSCWHEPGPRVSNGNSSRPGATELVSLIEREIEVLRGHPRQLQRLALRSAARCAEAGDRPQAIREIRLGLRQRVPPRDLARSLWRYGPFLARRLVAIR